MAKQSKKGKTETNRQPARAAKKVSKKKSNVADELVPVFNAIQSELKKYAPPFTSRQDSDKVYDLWSDKEVMFFGKVREVYFSSVVMQKKYVGFYYMPIYVESKLRTEIKPELLKKLKGKSCFHLQQLDDEMLKQIRDALRLGLELYKKRGWV